jgi:acetyl esterase/lipase
VYRRIAPVLALTLAPFVLAADGPAPEVPLWADGPPGFADRKDEKDVKTEQKDGEYLVTNVHNPTLTVFLPAKDKANGAAVVIAPGGGHRQLSFVSEGTNAAKWLNDRGVAAFVLKYRLPREKASPYKIPDTLIQDGQRAVRLVRARSAEWGVDPERVGILGFSAGGELAALTCVTPGAGQPDAKDPVDRQNARPAFQGLVYSGPIGIRGQAVTKEAVPPTFIAVGDSDNFSTMLAEHYVALKKAGVPSELHVYAKTGHGFGLRERYASRPSNAWIDRFEEFLKAQGFLKKS